MCRYAHTTKPLLDFNAQFSVQSKGLAITRIEVLNTPKAPAWKGEKKARHISAGDPFAPVPPLSQRKTHSRVINGVLLWADMAAANPLGAWGALCNVPCRLLLRVTRQWPPCFVAHRLQTRV